MDDRRNSVGAENDLLGRRQFLRQVTLTLLAALGFGTLSAARAEEADAAVCGIICYGECNQGSCNGGRNCPQGRRCFRCWSRCSGWWSPRCFRRSTCSDFCYSRAC